MRLGGPIMKEYHSPEEWVSHAKETGYSAVYFPLRSDADKTEITAYANAAKENDLLIAEVGAWSNPLSPDKAAAAKALAYCQNQLALADEVGAVCCVNIAGSLGDKWDGPHPDQFSEDTFALVVDSVRQIIDAVRPARTFYTLELMAWMLPDSADTYMALIHAIDRKSFAVHLDPVNIICSPRAFYGSGAVIRECFDKLGPYIKSCHAKDIMLEENPTVHLNERPAGEGKLDYRTYLQCLSRLPKDTPLMTEHLASREDEVKAAANIRRVAGELGISI